MPGKPAMLRSVCFLTGSVFAVWVLSACGDDTTTANQSAGPVESRVARAPSGPTHSAVAMNTPVRWYESIRIQRGAALYAQHCADCHGNNAQGNADWRKKSAGGLFPPPPLNGTGHAWHHPLRALGAQIKHGAPGGRGSMPGFSATLSDEQILDTIAWFQHQWPDDIYAAWSGNDMRARQAAQ
ncbi:MAG: mono/diheme cytochrome c family protein [Gammaproteobacteria bacterium]|jgi:mono/diheme cytochrome c family protein